jgi:hypothetical protein
MYHLYKRVGVTDGWYELWYEGLQLGFEVHCLGGVAQDVGKQGPAIICKCTGVSNAQVEQGLTRYTDAVPNED